MPYSSDTWVLKTSLGLTVGTRMLSTAPEDGKDYPEIPEEFQNKLDADRACLRWNEYLLHAWQKRSKTKRRISE